MAADKGMLYATDRRGIAALLVIFFRHNPLRMLADLVVTLAAGICEGIGVLTLLPVLVIASGGMRSDSRLSRLVHDGLAMLGIPPELGPLLTLVVLAIAATALLRLYAARIAGYAAVDFAAELRLALVQAFMTARWSYFVGQSTGRLSNAVTNEVNQAANLYSSVTSLIAAVLQVAIYLGLALVASIQVTVAGIVVGLLMIMALQRFVAVSRKSGARQVEAMTSLMSRIVEGLHLIKPLKAMAREDRLAPLLQADAAELKRAQRQLLVATAALGMAQEPIFVAFLAGGLYIAVTWLNYAIADLLFVAVLFQRIVTRIGHVQVLYQKAASFESGYLAVCRVLAEAAAAREPLAAGITPPTLARGVRLEHVTFAYDAKPVLQDLDLEIPAHRMTAIIGPSGAGKSTLVDLVIGLSRPQSGTVLIDGVPLSEIDPRAWRSVIGYVPQEVVLWHDTVANNVTLRDPKLRPDEVVAALRAAGAWDFVAALPDGVDTVVGERGARLSGGQRQRISIARALVRKPKLLVLDEPTTALDPETERAICRTLHQLSSEATALVISHQSAIADVADIVYRLHAGKAFPIERYMPASVAG
jgi:ATP-binding cassette, subfamily C, bacterial